MQESQIMNSDSRQSKSLRSIIKNILDKTNNHKLMSYIKVQTDLILLVIEEKPLYLSDGDICIQALMEPSSNALTIDPNNYKTTNFYGHHHKPQIVFNCHDDILENKHEEYSTPYHPIFHFKDYNRFLQGRNNAQIYTKCSLIYLHQFTISLINISRTGYYAPILIASNYKKMREPQILKKRVQNILFCTQFANKLLQFRSNDIRQTFQIKQEQNQMNNIVLAIRNNHKKQSMHYQSGLASLDKRGQMLKLNKQINPYYLPIGKLPHIALFKRPIENKYLSLQKSRLNYIQLYKQKQNQSDAKSSISLWSDSSSRHQQQQQIIEDNNMQQQYLIEIDSYSSEPDLLKDLYEDQIRNKMI